MGTTTLKILAKELNLSTAAISKALRDSHDISASTKARVKALAARLNYTPNPYAGSLRRRSSKTIALVLPEVADSFFSLAINGIDSVAEEKGYHVLIYLTHENYEREKLILNEFQNGRVDGVLMSITAETTNSDHIQNLCSKNIPLVFFDRVCEDVNTAKITTNDYESGYVATQHLIDQGCKKIAILSISSCLSISNKRLEGYKTALLDNKIKSSPSDIVLCTNNTIQNAELIRKMIRQKNRPDGIVATAEKLTTTIYESCSSLKLKIPEDIKVVCFSNSTSAGILNPSLTTITQPAFEMGKSAAILLFKALEKRSFNLIKENQVLSSVLTVRRSTKN